MQRPESQKLYLPSRLRELMLRYIPFGMPALRVLRRSNDLERTQAMADTPRVSGAIDKIADHYTLSHPPRGGIAFTVPELMLLSAWAEYHAIRMVIELDNCVDGAEYEEVVALYPEGSPIRQWTLWRAPDAVMMEAMQGEGLRAECICDVLDQLMPASAT